VTWFSVAYLVDLGATTLLGDAVSTLNRSEASTLLEVKTHRVRCAIAGPGDDDNCEQPPVSLVCFPIEAGVDADCAPAP